MMLELKKVPSESLCFGLDFVLVLFLLRLVYFCISRTGTDTGLFGDGRWVTSGYLVFCGAGTARWLT